MEKEALIDIILNDLKEVHALVKTFKGKNEINAAFINLSRTKIANINEELSLLEQLNGQKSTVELSKPSLSSEITSTSTGKDFEETAESLKPFIKEEANAKDKTVELEQTLIEKDNTFEQVVQNTGEPVEPGSQPIQTTKQEVQATEQEVQATGQEIQATKKTKTEPAKGQAVLGELIKQDNASVNEAIATSKDNKASFKQIGKPVNDVRKAIGLNDRFYFQRELFDNNANLFNETLDQVNQMDSFHSATSFLQSNFDWDTDNEVTQSFYSSIQRRFL